MKTSAITSASAHGNSNNAVSINDPGNFIRILFIIICSLIYYYSAWAKANGVQVSSRSLPVKLVRFNAARETGVIKLQWITTTGLKNQNFTIERSANGTDFEEILVVNGNEAAGEVTGKTNSAVSYTALDREPINGLSYYRLKLTGFDGTSEIFNTLAMIHREGTQSISILKDTYPNPFSDRFNLDFNVAIRGEIVVTVNDIHGRMVRTMTIVAEKGNNTLEFVEGAGLPDGIYFINLNYNGQSTQVKLIKNAQN